MHPATLTCDACDQRRPIPGLDKAISLLNNILMHLICVRRKSQVAANGVSYMLGISLGLCWYRVSKINSKESELFVIHSILIVLKRETM